MSDVPRESLHTGRLRLEPVSRDHLDGMWAATEASLTELRPWMIWSVTATRETTEWFIRDSEEGWAAGRAYRFTIVHEGEVAGTISIEVRHPLDRRGEVGYWIRSDLTGRGLTTEAGRAIVDFGFGVLRLHRLDLAAGTGNVASQRVAEKLGFRREGLARHASSGEAGHHDVFTYGLLEGDLREAAAR